jgi:hypothetical protein
VPALGEIRHEPAPQMKLLDAGSLAMAIFLGKIMLAQKDTASIQMTMPKIRTARDLGKAAEKVIRAVARGKLAPAEGEKMMSLIESLLGIIVAVEHGNRLEEYQAAAPAPPFLVTREKEDE